MRQKLIHVKDKTQVKLTYRPVKSGALFAQKTLTFQTYFAKFQINLISAVMRKVGLRSANRQKHGLLTQLFTTHPHEVSETEQIIVAQI